MANWVGWVDVGRSVCGGLAFDLAAALVGLDVPRGTSCPVPDWLICFDAVKLVGFC